MNDNEYVVGFYIIFLAVMLSNLLPEIVCATLIVVGIIIFIAGM